jgi:chorismate synthase
VSNTFGTHFRLTTFGESHGAAIGGVVDGCPAGIVIDRQLLSDDMARRHAGNAATSRREPDEVELLSGIYEETTLGTPIAFLIRNSQARSDDYDQLKELCRPGHADYTYLQRYGRRDHRGGGRASARETAARVAGGALAKMMLRSSGISIQAQVAESPAPADHDSSGGIITCTIDHLPAGIGDPIFDKLNARLAAAMMSIPSAIGFEMGAGFEAARMSGSQYRDAWNSDFTTRTNHCGGIQGGISNGMPVVFRTAFHPVVTIDQPTECIDANGNLKTITPGGRHDQCHLPRTVVIVEAMAALTLADFMARTNP